MAFIIKRFVNFKNILHWEEPSIHDLFGKDAQQANGSAGVEA